MIKISDLIYDAEIIFEDDDGELYSLKPSNHSIVDSYGVVVKQTLKKDKKLTKKELFN